MGYRSDVLLAVAFKNKADMEEVMAVYAMDPRVQEDDLVKFWKLHDTDTFPMLYYKDEGIKWYSDYNHVHGMEYLAELIDKFGEERDMQYAAVAYRIGEEPDDLEINEQHNDSTGHMQEQLWEYCGIHREIVSKF